MGRPKKSEKSVPKKIDYTQWSGGDRIGKKSRAMLREHQMRAIVNPKTVDADTFIDVLDNVIEIIDALTACEGSDSDPVLEEVANEIRGVEKARLDAISEAEEKVTEIEQKYDDLESSKAGAADDHAEDIRAHCAIIDELRKRAEIAEHNLTTGVHHGHVLDVEAEKKIATLTTENEQLTRMLAAMRATKPVRAR